MVFHKEVLKARDMKAKRVVNRVTEILADLLVGGDTRRGGESPLDAFLAHCRTMDHPRVLELGTKRSIESRSTLHTEWIPHAGEYLGTDIEAGMDVDIVADVHRLTEVTGEEQFDVIISCSTFEHFKYPHLAAHEVMKALRIGGVIYIQTHQSFPLHAYPHDYFRFSEEALAGLFGTQMGFRVRLIGYQYPVKLFPPRALGMMRIPAFLNVDLFGEKISATPRDYVFEYDVP
jgi:SAM-dependent methyltransferase